jgi:hypothetical protein
MTFVERHDITGAGRNPAVCVKDNQKYRENTYLLLRVLRKIQNFSLIQALSHRNFEIFLIRSSFAITGSQVEYPAIARRNPNFAGRTGRRVYAL